MLTAIFTDQDTARVYDAYQYSYGQKLYIHGLNLPDVVEIGFSLTETGGVDTPRFGITKDGVTEVVIPDAMMEGEDTTEDFIIYAFIFIEDETSGRTIKVVEIHVISRPKRWMDEESGDTFSEVVEQVRSLVEEYKKGGFSDEQIAEAVKAYLTENPPDGMAEEDVKTLINSLVPEWARQADKPAYTAEEVGAEPTGTAESKVSLHNISEESHGDIRLLITNLKNRIDTIANSDDVDLDQLAELVAYIKANRSLIESVTTSKVSVVDIIDNLITSVSDKPLSAKQGVVLKGLIDTLQAELNKINIPTTLPNPHKLIFAGAVTAEYDGSGAVTVTIPNGNGGSVTERIEKASTDSEVTLEPNKLYVFPEMETLTITLGEITDASIVNEYHFIFQSGATATTLTLPDTVIPQDNFTVEASKVYEVSILENKMCAQSWAVS